MPSNERRPFQREPQRMSGHRIAGGLLSEYQMSPWARARAGETTVAGLKHAVSSFSTIRISLGAMISQVR